MKEHASPFPDSGEKITRLAASVKGVMKASSNRAV
jgi:hypothetical protein